MAQRKFSDLTPVGTMEKTDLFVVEQPNGTKKMTLEQLCDAIKTPDIEEQVEELPEIEADDSLKVIAGKVNKWQKDALEKIEECIPMNKILQEFPSDEFDPSNQEDETTKELSKEVISAMLAYTMNTKILKLVEDHGKLVEDYEILKREQMASYGYFGVEWNIDELMMLVKAGKWDKFAIGDYFIETNTAGEKILFEVTGKNSYLHYGDKELNKQHIVVSPRDCLETYYKYNKSPVNAGGYAESLMPANLETEANKFTSKLQGYMTQIRRYENNKRANKWESRRIFLPGNTELVGFKGFADGYCGGAFNQLPLFVGGNAHLLKGAGFNKSKSDRMWYWTADPSAEDNDTSHFCCFDDYGASNNAYLAFHEGGIAPLIVLS